MRKIIEYCFISADGVVDNPNPIEMGVHDYVDEAYLRDSQGLFAACDAILWGRSTYEIFANIYGNGGGSPAYATRLNSIRKYVFSSTLDGAGWNNTVIVRGDVATEVAKLKQQDGGNLLVLGHGRLSETLLQHRLIDSIDLSIIPIMAGRGKCFLRENQAVKLKLNATKVFSRMVKLTYEPQY